MLDMLDMSLQATQTLCLHCFYMDKVLKSFMVTMFLKGHVYFVKIMYTRIHMK